MGFIRKIFQKKGDKGPSAEEVALSEAAALVAAESRDVDRSQTFHHATAITGSAMRIEGIAVDVSADGARLRFKSTSGLADIVRVKISSLRIDSAVELRWVDKSDVGVKFIA